jgi:hypothetical protein
MMVLAWMGRSGMLALKAFDLSVDLLVVDLEFDEMSVTLVESMDVVSGAEHLGHCHGE